MGSVERWPVEQVRAQFCFAAHPDRDTTTGCPHPGACPARKRDKIMGIAAQAIIPAVVTAQCNVCDWHQGNGVVHNLGAPACQGQARRHTERTGHTTGVTTTNTTAWVWVATLDKPADNGAGGS